MSTSSRQWDVYYLITQKSVSGDSELILTLNLGSDFGLNTGKKLEIQTPEKDSDTLRWIIRISYI